MKSVAIYYQISFWILFVILIFSNQLLMINEKISLSVSRAFNKKEIINKSFFLN